MRGTAWRPSLNRAAVLLAFALLPVILPVPAAAGAGPASGGAAGQVYFVSTTGSDEAPGTSEKPWATPEAAASRVKAGDTVLFRGGTYQLHAQVRVAASGTAAGWITFANAPGELATFDASAIRQFGPDPVPHHRANNGAVQIQGVSYVRVIGLRLVRSQDAGFVVRDSSHVDLINNQTDLTFSSGIAVWDSDNRGEATREIRVIGNTIHRATTWDMKPESFPRTKDGQPQESISIAGAVGFEVAWNQVSHGDKEGIDVKETSRQGRVHHNYVHHMGRQGLYVDAWFGRLSDVDLHDNVVHDCDGAGFAISVENGSVAERIRIRRNILFQNKGSGIFFSRWGKDGLRRAIEISGNVIHRNGHGEPDQGRAYYWITGGINVSSGNIENVSIRGNVISDNNGFQVGCSDLACPGGLTGRGSSFSRRVDVRDNLLYEPVRRSYPIVNGWPQSDTFDVRGRQTVSMTPPFSNPAVADFTWLENAPARVRGLGAYAGGVAFDPWWQRMQPPVVVDRR